MVQGGHLAQTGPIIDVSKTYHMNSIRERLSFLLDIELQSFSLAYAKFLPTHRYLELRNKNIRALKTLFEYLDPTVPEASP